MASATPAPKPHKSRWPAVKFPLASTLRFLNSSKAPNLQVKIYVEASIDNNWNVILYLTADFGIEP